jgi:hypothetical protein
MWESIKRFFRGERIDENINKFVGDEDEELQPIPEEIEDEIASNLHTLECLRCELDSLRSKGEKFMDRFDVPEDFAKILIAVKERVELFMEGYDRVTDLIYQNTNVLDGVYTKYEEFEEKCKDCSCEMFDTSLEQKMYVAVQRVTETACDFGLIVEENVDYAMARLSRNMPPAERILNYTISTCGINEPFFQGHCWDDENFFTNVECQKITDGPKDYTYPVIWAGIPANRSAGEPITPIFVLAFSKEDAHQSISDFINNHINDDSYYTKWVQKILLSLNIIQITDNESQYKFISSFEKILHIEETQQNEKEVIKISFITPPVAEKVNLDFVLNVDDEKENITEKVESENQDPFDINEDDDSSPAAMDPFDIEDCNVETIDQSQVLEGDGTGTILPEITEENINEEKICEPTANVKDSKGNKIFIWKLNTEIGGWRTDDIYVCQTGKDIYEAIKSLKTRKSQITNNLLKGTEPGDRDNIRNLIDHTLEVLELADADAVISEGQCFVTDSQAMCIETSTFIKSTKGDKNPDIWMYSLNRDRMELSCGKKIIVNAKTETDALAIVRSELAKDEPFLDSTNGKVDEKLLDAMINGMTNPIEQIRVLDATEFFNKKLSTVIF